MVVTWIARILGIVVAVLALAGLFVEGRHFAGILNVDIALDLARIVIAIALLWVGFARVRRSALTAVLAIVGIVYILMALVAFFDREILGLLPTGFTGFDIGFNLVAGLLALVAAFVPDRTHPRTVADGPTVARGR